MSDGAAESAVEVAVVYMYQVENLPAFADMEELRWKTLIGSDGDKIGTIEKVERDEETDRVEFLQIGHGGFLGFHADRFLVPVTVIVNVDDKNVYIDRSLQTLQDVPEYDFERVSDPDYCATIRAWWCEPISSGGPAPQPEASPAP